jgi:hypothetical protein
VKFNLGVVLIEVLGICLALIRLVKFKREVDGFRPQSPLPKRRFRHNGTSIMRVS